MRRISFEKLALNVRELSTNYENVQNEYSFDFDELILRFEEQKEKLTNCFWSLKKKRRFSQF